MKNYRKVINHLYLGDYQSRPESCNFVLSAANDFFAQQTAGKPAVSNKSYLSADEKQLALNLLDYPDIGDVDSQTLKIGLEFIDKHLKLKEDVYVHCVWGVNRSPALVFIYLVTRNYLPTKSFEMAWKQFKKLYPRTSPNPAYWHYLNANFPYRDLILE